MTTNERPAVMIVPRFTALGASYFDRGRLLPLAEVLALLNAQEGLRAALVEAQQALEHIADMAARRYLVPGILTVATDALAALTAPVESPSVGEEVTK
jgi:hypothetical protein